MRQGDLMAAPTLATDPLPAKRRQILAGARQVFTELGFERASVDLIAARAGVSKATIYNHYADKTALFVACVTQDADELHRGLRACLAYPCDDVEQALQRIGENLMHLYLSPSVMALFRHVMAEAARLPDVGRTIYDRGPTVIYDAVAAHLRRWHDAGALRIEDPRAAAVQFVALCQGDLMTRARLGILEDPLDPEALRAGVRSAVHTFVRAYRP
jgi:AcrR family transcriptional regulator